MRIVFLYPPLMMAWLEQLVGAICLLTAGTACQRIYNIFLEGLFCIFARLVRGLQTNSVGSITSRILLMNTARHSVLYSLWAGRTFLHVDIPSTILAHFYWYSACYFLRFWLLSLMELTTWNLTSLTTSNRLRYVYPLNHSHNRTNINLLFM